MDGIRLERVFRKANIVYIYKCPGDVERTRIPSESRRSEAIIETIELEAPLKSRNR